MLRFFFTLTIYCKCLQFTRECIRRGRTSCPVFFLGIYDSQKAFANSIFVLITRHVKHLRKAVESQQTPKIFFVLIHNFICENVWLVRACMSGQLASVILPGIFLFFCFVLFALLLHVYLSDWFASKRRSGTASSTVWR